MNFPTLSKLGAPVKFLSGGALVAVLLGLTLAVTLAPAPTAAQSGGAITTGVVVDVLETANGDLLEFTLSDGDGDEIVFEVESATEFGLDDESGARWTATLSDADAPRQAAQRLIDHRERFAPITVTAAADNPRLATLVVEAAAANLETNLGYIVAAFLTGWVAFFAYLIWVSIKQNRLKSQLKYLRQKYTIKDGDADKE